MIEPGRLSPIRLMIVAGILLLGIGATYYGSRTTMVHIDAHVRFDTFPKQIGEWNYVSTNRFDRDVEEMLGADAYIDNIYVSRTNREIEALVSYYGAMYEGKQFHSPKNCMLGSGWEALETGQMNLILHGRQTLVNFMIVRKDARILYVTYWIQGRGRLLASEYKERLYRVVDSFIKKRTDGAFVRVSLPGRQEDRAQDLALLTQFSAQLASNVESYLPH